MKEAGDSVKIVSDCFRVKIVIRKDGEWRFGRFPSDVGFTRLVRVPKRKVKANSKPANLSHLWAHGASGNTPALQAGIEGSTPSGSTI